jgi:CO dehydrogenase/acetyl-CoA synthase beta subunit
MKATQGHKIDTYKNILQKYSSNKESHIYQIKKDFFESFGNLHKFINPNSYKDIILKDETKIELGGPNNKSILVIEPTTTKNLVDDGNITLIGSDLGNFLDKSIDFGLLIFIEFNKIFKNYKIDWNNLKYLSDGIEGFMIRSIPRKFWCRIDKKFFHGNYKFEYLGFAIYHLFKKQYSKEIKKLEITFISSNFDLIQNLIDLNREMIISENDSLRSKIDNWKDEINCEYNWNCQECPYIEECTKIKQILRRRTELERKM